MPTGILVYNRMSRLMSFLGAQIYSCRCHTDSFCQDIEEQWLNLTLPSPV